MVDRTGLDGNAGQLAGALGCRRHHRGRPVTRAWEGLRRRDAFQDERRLVVLVMTAVALPLVLTLWGVMPASITAPWLFTGTFIAGVTVAGVVALRPLTPVVFNGLIASEALIVGMQVMASGATRSLFMVLFLILVVGSALVQTRRGFAITAGAVVVASASVVVLDPRVGADVWAVWAVQAVVTVAIGAAINVQSISRANRGRRLEESERKFRMLAENASDGVYLLALTPERRFEYVNPALTRLAGLTVDDFYANPDIHLGLIHPDDREIIARSRVAGLDEPVDVRVRREGGWGWVSLVARPVRDESGQVVAVQGILRDVTVRRRAEDALREAYRQQQLAVEERHDVRQMRDGFLQAISHEVRTPLTSIRGFAHLLATRASVLDADTHAQMLERLDVNAQKLEALLIDLLDVARLGSDSTPSDRHEPVELDRIVEQAVRRHVADDREVRIEVSSPPLDIAVDHVQRIVDALVDNAVRHTPTATPIGIGASLHDHTLRLHVADRGPGIPDADKTAIFEPFHQGAHTVHDPSPGAGLGLALVDQYARLHGGRAWVEDRPGGGCTFHVELDLAQDAERRRDPAHTRTIAPADRTAPAQPTRPSKM